MKEVAKLMEKLKESEAIRVGNWPVQFVPTFSLLTEEAVREAETGEIAGIPVRVVSAIHLAVIALSVGRPKDHLRILSLIEARAVHEEALQELAVRHNLSAQWSVSEKLGAPFSVMVTSDTFDFSDPSILRVPAFML